MFKKVITILSLILLMISCGPSTKKSLKETPAVSGYFNGYVVRDNINLRADATTKSAKVAKLNDGDEVMVLQNNNGWYQIQTVENKGWVRSDFVGDKSFSYSILAANFMEKVTEEYKTELFIDDDKPYAVIYMVLPDEYYDDKLKARHLADEIGIKYQQQVYPGEVEIRILQQNKKKLFIRSVLKSTGLAYLKPPFLRYGRPHSFRLNNGSQIIIKVLVPSELTDKKLIDMAYEIASGYGDEISKVEIYIVDDTIDGQKYFADKNHKFNNSTICRVYFIEDSQGADYKTDFCKTY